MKIDREGNLLKISIADNGNGFDEEKINDTDHYGIHNMRTRAHELNGKLDVESKEGKGTTITVSVAGTVEK